MQAILFRRQRARVAEWRPLSHTNILFVIANIYCLQLSLSFAKLFKEKYVDCSSNINGRIYVHVCTYFT